MSFEIAALVLFAALLHASWNALLKAAATVSGHDGDGYRHDLTALRWCRSFPRPALPVGLYCRSALLHVGYNFLVRAYRNGDFGSAYPVARGSSPLAGDNGAAVTVARMARADRPDRYHAGQQCIVLARPFATHASGSGHPLCLGTGLFIAAIA